MSVAPPRFAHRARRIALIALAVLVALPIAFAVFVATYDWNRAKPWLSERASRAFGRAIAIDGDVDVTWHWRTRVDGADRFSPGFGLAAKGLGVGNPDWAKRPHFAELESLDMSFRLLPLLWHKVDIPLVRAAGAKIDLEQRADGSNMDVRSRGRRRVDAVGHRARRSRARRRRGRDRGRRPRARRARHDHAARRAGSVRAARRG